MLDSFHHKGVEVALLYSVLLANGCAAPRQQPLLSSSPAQHRADTRLEATYLPADAVIQKVVHLLAAA
jgi:hypothetical protein